MVLFYGYKFLKIDVQGDESSFFFGWNFKVCPKAVNVFIEISFIFAKKFFFIKVSQSDQCICKKFFYICKKLEK